MYFWKWWTIFVLSLAGVLVAEYFLNASTFIVQNDPTFITIFIIAIAAITTLAIGFLSYMKHFNKKDYNIEFFWFIAEAVMSVGMIGTLVGFLLVLTSAFQDVDTTSAAAMKEVIGQLAAGMGVALITSLAGLITSLYIKIQLVLLEN